MCTTNCGRYTVDTEDTQLFESADKHDRLYYAILHEKMEHLQILVFMGALEPATRGY